MKKKLGLLTATIVSAPLLIKTGGIAAVIILSAIGTALIIMIVKQLKN